MSKTPKRAPVAQKKTTLESMFLVYLQKEGLNPKTAQSLNILKRAYYSGASDTYSKITKASSEAKLGYPGNAVGAANYISGVLKRLKDGLNLYWLSEVKVLEEQKKARKAKSEAKNENIKKI